MQIYQYPRLVGLQELGQADGHVGLQTPVGEHRQHREARPLHQAGHPRPLLVHQHGAAIHDGAYL